MADTERKFKFTPFGGFRRQDVITYIEALMGAHHEEIDAYRSGAELLRRERDDALERLTVLQAQTDELNHRSKQLPSMQSDMDSLKARINQLTADKTRLNGSLQKMEGAREADRTAMSRLQFLLSEKEGRLTEMQAQLDELTTAYATAEDIEKNAYERAKAIDTEALENTSRSRDLISRLWAETKARYTTLCKEADEASSAAVRELEKARDLLIGAGQMFDGVNSRLENMKIPEKTGQQPSELEEPLSGSATSLSDLLAEQKKAQSEQAPVQPVQPTQWETSAERLEPEEFPTEE